MRKIKAEEIKTERELQLVLIDLEKRWNKALAIKNLKRRLQEVLLIRSQIKQLLEISKSIGSKPDSNEGNFFRKCSATIRRWWAAMEKRYQ